MKGKTEPPLGLDMDFGEALRRFIQVDPKELAENVATAKQKRELQEQPPPKEVDDATPKRQTKPLN